MVTNLPNIAHLSVRWNLLWGEFDYSSTGILDRTHLRFYTKRTARELIERSGLRVTTLDVNQGIDQMGLFRKTSVPLLRRTPWQDRILYEMTRVWPEGLALSFLFCAQAQHQKGTPTWQHGVLRNAK